MYVAHSTNFCRDIVVLFLQTQNKIQYDKINHQRSNQFNNDEEQYNFYK